MKKRYCKTGRSCEDCSASQYEFYPDGEYYVSGCDFGLINYNDEMSWEAFAQSVIASYKKEKEIENE